MEGLISTKGRIFWSANISQADEPAVTFG